MRNIIIFIFCLTVFSVATLVVNGSATDKISGWAWSDNVGWISLNCTDVSCSSSNYGVTVNLSTGNFSGYAWSEIVGWINFAPTSGFPEAPLYGACVDSPSPITAEACNGIGNYRVAGWARVVACETPGACNGWDGWIKLGEADGSWGTSTGTQVKINSSTLELEGWAWGSDVIGWISFNCANTNSCQ